RQNEEEVSALYQDLLITVTEFFRDARAFNFLKDAVIPKILEGLPNDTPARVWVPGCASGEEAYSIAICFAEAAHGRGNVPVRIFATDVSNACIAAASRAVYPANITANVSRERLRRFFVKQDGGYRIAHTIRDACIFAKQDVISDPPLPRMDLVSCQNLLIYFDIPTQREVLRYFHYALKFTGLLMLGACESTAADPQLFEQVQKPYRIYSKIADASQVDFSLSR